MFNGNPTKDSSSGHQAHSQARVLQVTLFGALRFIALILILPVALAGEEAPRPEEQLGTPPTPRFHQTITVRAQSLENAGAALSVMERDEIAASGMTALSGVLREVAGLHVTESGSRGGVTTVEIRGGDPTHTLILLDGVPLNDGTGSQGDVCDLAGLSSDDIERIEVIRGPVSTFYGSRALAGVVQIFSNRTSKKGTYGAARVDVGHYDLRRLGARLASATGARHGILSLAGEREQGRVGDDRFAGMHLQGQAGLPIFGRRLHLRTRFGHRTGDDYPDASGGPLFGDGALRHSESSESSLSASWMVDAHAERRQTVDVVMFRRALDRESPAVAPVVPSSMEATSLNRLRLGWSGTFSLLRGLALQSGLDIEREEGTNDSSLSLGPEIIIPGDYAIARTTTGVFAGIAGDLAAFSGDLTLRIDVANGHATQANPRASLSYHPRTATWWRARASIGRGFKLPSFYALASPSAIGGNPDLRPETSIGGDFGVDVKRGPVAASLSLFRNRYFDLIDFEFGAMQLVNRARVTSSGVEAALAWKPFSSLTLSSSMTHLATSDPSSDEPILHQPTWTINAILKWTPSPSVRLRLDARSVSRALDRQIPVPERDHVPGHTLLGGAFSWRPASLWRIEARCDNLTDSRYETLIGFPGPRRSLRVGLRFGGD
jgi:vitamin B12 transporter